MNTVASVSLKPKVNAAASQSARLPSSCLFVTESHQSFSTNENAIPVAQRQLRSEEHFVVESMLVLNLSVHESVLKPEHPGG